jgi:hypothetical protein
VTGKARESFRNIQVEEICGCDFIDLLNDNNRERNMLIFTLPKRIFLSIVVITLAFISQIPSQCFPIDVGGIEDLTPPRITELAFTPSSVNTSNGPQVVTFTLRITDDLSGFDYAYLYLYSPSNQSFVAPISSVHLISGDSNDGVYRVNVTIPQYAEQGDWTYSIYGWDRVTNQLNLGPVQITELGLPKTIHVESINDVTPPRITELAFTPSSVNTSNGPQVVTFTLSITDDLSGFDYAYLYLYSPSGNQFLVVPISSSHLISGDLNDGLYRVNATFPQYSEQGDWKICISLWDLTNNQNWVCQVPGSPSSIRVYQNQPPSVDAGENISLFSESLSNTTINGTARDPDSGAVLRYRWLKGQILLLDWSPVGSEGTCPLPLAGISLLPGAHTLTLEVSDGQANATDDMILNIDNSAPHAAPVGAGHYQANTPVTLAGQLSDYDGDTLYYSWMDGTTILYSGSINTQSGGYPVQLPDFTTAILCIGVHTITLQVSDGINPPVSKIFSVTVYDNIAPSLKPTANQTLLWPPDHRMVNITIKANASDNSGLSPTLTASVLSNEPQDGLGDGDMSPDWTQPVIDQNTGTITLQLRSERSGKGTGRTYTIKITATDSAGNSSTADVNVIVPHDKAKK